MKTFSIKISRAILWRFVTETYISQRGGTFIITAVLEKYMSGLRAVLLLLLRCNLEKIGVF